MFQNRIVVLCDRMVSFSILLLVLSALEISVAAQGSVANQGSPASHVMGDPVDVSQDFAKGDNTYFVGTKVAAFDPASGSGSLQWNRHMRRTFFSFNKIDRTLTPDKGNEFPAEYDENPTLFTHAVHHGSGQRVFGSWLPDAAHALF